MNKLFYETIKKYGLAISQNLHPSQTKRLKEGLIAFEKGEEVYFSDSYVGLAFDMIMSDLFYQKERGEVNEKSE